MEDAGYIASIVGAGAEGNARKGRLPLSQPKRRSHIQRQSMLGIPAKR